MKGEDRAFSRRLARVAALVLLTACATLAFLDPALAGSVPTDESGFTSYVAKAFSLALPNAQVGVKGPLSLEIRSASGGAFAADLRTTYSYCQRNADDCDRAVAKQVTQMSAAFRQAGAPPDRAALRAVVRTTPYIDKLRQAMAGKGEPIAAPLVADLWVTCVFDLPTAIQYVKPADLEALKLTRDEAIALGRRNVEAVLPPPPSDFADAKADGIGFIGDDYAASGILSLGRWKALADKAGGRLIVSVPATDALLYGDASSPRAVQAMRKMMEMVAQRANRPLSPTILRWKPDGWEPVGR